MNRTDFSCLYYGNSFMGDRRVVVVIESNEGNRTSSSHPRSQRIIESNLRVKRLRCNKRNMQMLPKPNTHICVVVLLSCVYVVHMWICAFVRLLNTENCTYQKKPHIWMHTFVCAPPFVISLNIISYDTKILLAMP